MGDITGRLTKCDATVISIGGEDVLAIATECSVRIMRDIIDVSAPMDTAKSRENCQIDWEVQIGKLIATSEVFGALILTGGSCVVSVDAPTGATFYGVGLMANYEASWDDPVKESLTIQCADGNAPTLT